MYIDKRYKIITHRVFPRLLMALLLIFFNEKLFAIDFEVNGINYYTNAVTNTTVKVTGKTNSYNGAIVIPESVSYEGHTYSVTSIDEYAFSNNTDITSIEIPQTITYIDDWAFNNCTNIETVYITSIESWCKIEFEDGDSNPLLFAKHLIVDGEEQNDIIIPEGVEYLNDWAFDRFIGIHSVTLPSTLKWIDRAFGGCANLSLVICNKTTPPYVEDNMWRPFSDISPKAKLIVPKGTISAYYSHPVWGNSFKRISEDLNYITFEDPDVKSICVSNWDTNGDGELNYDEAETVTDLGKAFVEDRNVNTFRELIYFAGLKRIASKTFHDCRNLSLVQIPENVETINSKAFHRCTSLNSIDIPSNVKTIAGEAFDGCTGLASVNISNGVETIGSNAFYTCAPIKTISIPASVSSIGTQPFPHTIESIEINKNNQKYESPKGSNCIISKETKTVIFGNNKPTIPTGTLHIGANAFSGCGFSEIILPKSVESIGNEAFMSCGNLTAISLPKNITELAESVFKGCSSLSNIEFPSNITIIGNSAFESCLSIPEIIIPQTVSSIGSSTFRNCTSLSSVVLPNSLSTMGSSAFAGCTSLAIVESNIVLPFEITNVFSGISPESELHVPYGKKTLYELTKGWSVFGEIIEAEPQQFELNIATAGNGSVKCNGKTIRNQSLNIVVTEGYSTTISLYPDTGYRIASLVVNEIDALAQLKDNQLVVSVTDNANVEIVFEAIPISTYDLSISASGNGSANYNGTTIRNIMSSFSLNGGTAVAITLAPDNGYRVKSVMVNGVDVTSSVANNQYTINNISQNTTVNVTFEENSLNDGDLFTAKTAEGVDMTFMVISAAEKTCQVSANSTFTPAINKSTSGTVTIPRTINGFTVASIGDYSFNGCSGLTSIIIPISVTSIGYGAFMDCSGLSSMTIPNSVMSIESAAFFGCI